MTLPKNVLRKLKWNKNLTHIQKWTILSKADHIRFETLRKITPFESDSEFLRVLVNIGLNQIENYLSNDCPDYYQAFEQVLNSELIKDLNVSRHGYLSFDEMFLSLKQNKINVENTS